MHEGNNVSSTGYPSTPPVYTVRLVAPDQRIVVPENPRLPEKMPVLLETLLDLSNQSACAENLQQRSHRGEP